MAFEASCEKYVKEHKYHYFITAPSLGGGIERNFNVKGYKVQPFISWSIGLSPSSHMFGFGNSFVLQVINPFSYFITPTTSFGINFMPKREFFLTERLEPYLRLAMDRPGFWPNDIRVEAGLFYHINDNWLFYYESNAFINIIREKFQVQDVDKGLWVYNGMRLGFRYYFRK